MYFCASQQDLISYYTDILDHIVQCCSRDRRSWSRERSRDRQCLVLVLVLVSGPWVLVFWTRMSLGLGLGTLGLGLLDKNEFVVVVVAQDFKPLGLEVSARDRLETCQLFTDFSSEFELISLPKNNLFRQLYIDCL